MKNLLICYPEIPDFPTALVPDLEQYRNASVISIAPTRTCSRNGVVMQNCIYERHPASEEIVEWVRQNIGTDFTDVGISYHGGDGVPVGLPHTDATRDRTLMWLLDTGGDDVETVHWIQNGHPFHRPINTYPTTYDDLIEIQRARLPLHKWYMVDARAIHSVENFTRARISVQVGFRNTAETVRRWLGEI